MRELRAKVTAGGAYGVVLLLLVPPISATPPEASRGANLASPGVVQTVHALMQAGQVENARRLILTAIDASPADPQLLCLQGDILFRQSKFDEAEKAYRAALVIAPPTARAHFGLGRVDQLRFHRKSAHEHIATAYQLDWHDPEIILAYAHYVPDREARKVLLQNFLALTPLEDKGHREDVVARVEMEERLGARKLAAMDSPYRDYKLPLETFIAPNGQTSGVLLKASINHGSPLRLILDTGADGILLTSKAVRNLGLETLTRSQISGLGQQAPANALVAVAQTVEIEDFRLQDCVLQISDAALTPGADGIIGANVFQEFLIRLKARSHVLELSPFSSRAEAPVRFSDPWVDYEGSSYDGPVCESCDHLAPAYRVGHLLLLRATLNSLKSDGQQDGYFLLDSGSTYSAVSQDVANRLPGGRTHLLGARGPLDGVSQSRPMRLDVGAARLADFSPVSLDLTEMSRQEGVEISGIVGFSVVSKAVLTINYRDGLVGFGR
ncbi:MAG: aspartyl protease family protein [Acidobacteriia bacterium]|nr:aspartyl protease family protein [Terriglobia bacterium]